MQNLQAPLTIILILFLMACANSQPHRFLHNYNTPQALRFVHEVLKDLGYRIAVFDISAGIIKTEPRDFIDEEGETVRYQISVTVVKLDELLVRVTPASVWDYRDQIMGPIIDSFRSVSIVPKYIPPSPAESGRSQQTPPLPPIP